MKRFLVLVFILGMFTLRFWCYGKTHVSTIPEQWFGTTTTVVGTIAKDPDCGLTATKIVLAPLLPTSLSHEKGSSNILVTLPPGANVFYGDTISIKGKILRPEPFDTDTGRSFNYPRYLAVSNIYGVMYADHVTVISVGRGNRMLTTLFLIKRHFVDTIRHVFSQEEGGLLAGILIGQKTLLSKDVLSDLQISGLTHLVVLSGFNVAVIAACTTWVLSWVGCGYRARRLGAFVTVPLLLAMTGFGTSSVRAGIMALVVFGLQIMTRRAKPFRIILVTIGIMVFVNPRIMLGDPAFHISLLAVIGLTYLAPVFDAWLGSLAEKSVLRRIAIQTLSVQLFIMPYVIWMSGTCSALLIVANILTVPLIAMVMAAGMGVVGVFLANHSLGFVASVPVRLSLAYIIDIARWVASVKWAIVTVPPFSVWVMIACYGILLLLLIKFHTTYL